MRGASDPQLAGRAALLYALRTTDVEGNRRITRAMLLSTDGGTPRQLPRDTAVRATEAGWSPDGAHVAYIAGGQLWLANSDGPKPCAPHRSRGGASGPIWSPTGAHLAFVSMVTPECRVDACNRGREKAREDRQGEGARHRAPAPSALDHMGCGDALHLFVVSVDGKEVRDVTAGY
ncbi:MAG: hypothetical protein M3125_03320 [Gemmatimonadota bacterium]|nr:hypothetical protein [Gemmatimonadota bacterium]